jgi:Txe/YoeB family toxin of Txe-Axe toxin-antitoxin module
MLLLNFTVDTYLNTFSVAIATVITLSFQFTTTDKKLVFDVIDTVATVLRTPFALGCGQQRNKLEGKRYHRYPRRGIRSVD